MADELYQHEWSAKFCLENLPDDDKSMYTLVERKKVISVPSATAVE